MKEAFIRVWVNNVKKSKFQLFQENLIMMDSSRMDEQALEKMFRVIEKKKSKMSRRLFVSTWGTEQLYSENRKRL